MQVQLSHLGTGRRNSPALLVITGRSIALSTAERWARSLGEEYALYVVSDELPRPENVEEFAEALMRTCRNEGLRRLTVLGIGRGGSVALAFAICATRMVRRLVVINTTSRMAPGLFDRSIDWIEEVLPLGLPLRTLSKAFDARPMLHRIHCPALVLTTPSARPFVSEQAKLLAGRIPNAWGKHLSDKPLDAEHRLSDELRGTLRNFLQVPVKRPQKNA